MTLDDWKDPRNDIELRAWEIDPWNLNVVRSEITGLIPASCSIDTGYYSDTRASAKICALDFEIEDGSWIRLALEVPNTGYTEELFTGPVASIQTTEVADSQKTVWEAQSAVWAISEDMQASHWTVGKGSSASSVINKVCSAVGKSYLFSGFHEYTFGQTVTYEVDDSFANILFDVCDRSSNRMDVDGHGRLVFSRYYAPSARSADWTLDERDARSLIVDVGDEEDSPGDAYGRAIVICKNGDKEVLGQANVSATHRASSQKRGYLRSKVYTESDLSPATAARASSKAREYLADICTTKRELTITCMWFPVCAGDMLRLVRLDGSKRDWLVQSVSCDLSAWTKKLTLKEK